MKAKSMDNRLNAARVLDRGIEVVGHVGFPPVCDEWGYDAKTCVQDLVCPVYAQAEEDLGNLEGKERDIEGEEGRREGEEGIREGEEETTTEKQAVNKLNEELKDNTKEVKDISQTKKGAEERTRIQKQAVNRVKEALKHQTKGVQDITQNKQYQKECEAWRKDGRCVTDARFMFEVCASSCMSDLCFDNLGFDCATMDCGLEAVAQACSYTCGRCGQVGTHFKVNQEGDKLVRRCRNAGMTYDNYAYTVVDAVVQHATHKSILHWMEQLLFLPLDMKDTLKCTYGRMDVGSEATCFKGLETKQQVVDVDKWQERAWNVAESAVFSGNALVMSVQDMQVFFQAVLQDDAFLSREIKAQLFNAALKGENGRSLLGVQAFGMGMGYCAGVEPFEQYGVYKQGPKHAYMDKAGGSLCRAPDVWTWMGSHAARFILLPDHKAGCVVGMNLPLSMSARGHESGHYTSSIMRKMFPLEEGYKGAKF